MLGNLKIVTWNTNGILNRKLELEAFLLEQKIDICLISETHMTKTSTLKLRGYKIYSTIHPDNLAKGGCAIIIKENIKHNEESSIQTEQMQLAVIEVLSTKQKFKVGSLYCPPKFNINKSSFHNVFVHLGERFILGGDYNAKHLDWGSRITTTRGKALRDAIREIGGNYHSTGKPTYWPTDTMKIPDLIDFFITKKISPNFVNIDETFDLDSDHSAVVLTLSEKIIKKENKPSLTNSTTDWLSFKSELENKIDVKIKLETKNQLEEEVENLITNIQSAAVNNTRIVSHRSICNNYPNEIRELIIVKRKARRKWQKSRDPSDKTILNNKSQELKRRIQKFKEESINKYLENLTADEKTNYSLWKATKRIKRPILHIPPIRKDNGNWARNNKEKA